MSQRKRDRGDAVDWSYEDILDDMSSSTGSHSGSSLSLALSSYDSYDSSGSEDEEEDEDDIGADGIRHKKYTLD